MLEIAIHGQRGQGARTARQLLADAFLASGRPARAFVAGGGERADHALVLDPSRLADLRPGSLRGGAVVVVNSPVAPCGWSPRASQVVAVDATRIAAEAGLGPIVSPAVLGAFAAATDLLSLDALTAAIASGRLARRPESVDACTAGYLAVRAARGSGATVTS
jgi:Pyruvate/2-oxoacid:ferredoxin oxidoreductase gamma subunit